MAENHKSSLEGDQETEEAKTLVTKAEKTVSTAVEDLVDDEALIEEDGDIFWTIQKVFWGIFKTLTLLGGMIFILWLVWKPDTSVFEKIRFESVEEIPAKEIEEETSIDIEKKESPSFWENIFSKQDTKNSNQLKKNTVRQPLAPEEKKTIEARDGSSLEMAYALESSRTKNVGSLISLSVEWLKRAKNVGEISLQVIRIREPKERAKRIESLLEVADNLFTDSNVLQRSLAKDRDEFLLKGKEYNIKTAELDKVLKSHVSTFEPQLVESALSSKIESQQLAVFYMQQAKLRDTLLRNIQSFDGLLRQRSIPLLKPATEIRSR